MSLHKRYIVASLDVERKLDIHGGELGDQILEDVRKCHPLHCAPVTTEPALHLAAPAAPCHQSALTSGVGRRPARACRQI